MTPQILRILAAGLLAGTAYLPITLQTMLGGGHLNQSVQTVTLYFFPLCWAFLGLGFVAPPLRSRFSRIAAVCLFVFLVLALALPMKLNSQVSLGFRIFALWVPAAFFYFFTGRELHGLLRGPRVHLLYGIFLVSLAAGGVASDVAIPHFGGNGWLLMLTLAAFTGRFALPALAVTGLLVMGFQIDLAMERLRNVAQVTPYDRGGIDLKKTTAAYLTGYARAFERLAWNRRGQTFLYRDETLESYVGLINLQAMHRFPFVADVGSNRIDYQLLKPGDDVLFVGVGTGRSLAALPERLLSPRIVAVERDENTVRLMRANGLNPNLERVTYVAQDGRAYIEQSAKKWDWIILESSLNQRNMSPIQLFQPYNLYTREALAAYWDKLKPGGTLIVEIIRPENKARRNASAAVIRSADSVSSAAARRLDVLVGAGREEDVGPLLVHLRKGGEELSRASLGFGFERISGARDFPLRRCVSPYDDDQPFLDWMCFAKRDRTQVLILTFGPLAFFVLVLIYLGRSRPRREGLALGIYTAQAVAHAFLFVGLTYALQSSFQDEIGTFYVFTYFTTLVAAGASFYMQYRLDRGGRPHFAKTAVGMIASLGWMFAILQVGIPQVEGLVFRFALMAIAVSPFFFVSSLMFHINLQRGRAREIFLLDSIGLFPAYLALPWILFEHGISALLLAAALLYALMIGLMRIQGEETV